MYVQMYMHVYEMYMYMYVHNELQIAFVHGQNGNEKGKDAIRPYASVSSYGELSGRQRHTA